MRILLVQTSYLGDAILSTPVIAALRRLNPGAEVWLMTRADTAAVFERDPRLTGVIVFDKRGASRGLFGLLRTARQLRKHRFDAVYALQRSLRTTLLLALAGIPRRVGFKEAAASWLYHRAAERLGEHDVLRNLSLLAHEPGMHDYPAEMQLFPRPLPECSEGTRSAVSGGRYALVAPGSAWETKRWHWEGFRELTQRLLGAGFRVVLTGAPQEAQVARLVGEGLEVQNLAGLIPLADIPTLVAHSAVVVCNDSAVQHMASALKIPNVVIFCATSPSFGFGPWRNRAAVLEREGLTCKPCARHGARVCPTGTYACMRELPAARVFEAVCELVGDNLPASQ